MAYDEVRGVVVLFGGAANGNTFDDTWTWDGQTWTSRPPGVKPPARWLHTMVYDSVRQRVVMFGGRSAEIGGMFFSDTWEWDGAIWSSSSTVGGPLGRAGHAMAYDRTRGVTVMFGGGDAMLAFDDTWEWDGQMWTRRYFGSPPRRGGIALYYYYGPMTYDERMQRVVMFGGSAIQGMVSLPPLGDTWEWDGSLWVQSPSGPGREGHAIGYDPVRGRIVVAGGYRSGGFALTTLEREGTTWWSRAQPAPPGRSLAAMAHDRRHGRMVLFGGNGYSDTWEYFTTAVASYAPFGSGCAGSAGMPALSAAPISLPWVGATFSADLTGLPSAAPAFMYTGFSKASWGPLTLPLSLGGAWGMPGCNLLVAPRVVEAVTVQGGTAQWNLAIPNQTSLVGVSFFNQALIVDPPANPTGAVLTNAAEGLTGAK